jgi:hypothetical protein
MTHGWMWKVGDMDWLHMSSFGVLLFTDMPVEV